MLNYQRVVGMQLYPPKDGSTYAGEKTVWIFPTVSVVHCGNKLK
jgi:hypothetical protein